MVLNFFNDQKCKWPSKLAIYQTDKRMLDVTFPESRTLQPFLSGGNGIKRVKTKLNKKTDTKNRKRTYILVVQRRFTSEGGMLPKKITVEI